MGRSVKFSKWELFNRREEKLSKLWTQRGMNYLRYSEGVKFSIWKIFLKNQCFVECGDITIILITATTSKNPKNGGASSAASGNLWTEHESRKERNKWESCRGAGTKSYVEISFYFCPSGFPLGVTGSCTLQRAPRRNRELRNTSWPSSCSQVAGRRWESGFAKITRLAKDSRTGPAGGTETAAENTHLSWLFEKSWQRFYIGESF